ncbi:hypothetical protein MMC11_001320 [Xylographa trunciseda]|nr:hypothetical protein [Xylographa trunciseda]
MTALALNPLSVRKAQPDVFHIRRKYSVRQRKVVNLTLISTQISPHVEGNTRPNNKASIDDGYTANERGDIHSNAVSRSVWANQHRRNTTSTTHIEPRLDYRSVLQEKLFAARTAQEAWREDITREAERRDAVHRHLLQLAKEEQERFADGEKEALERDNQQQIETQLARLATIRLRRQLEAEELRREAEQRRLDAEKLEVEAQQWMKDEEDALALQQAISIAEELQRQEEAEAAERQRIAGQRECTVCLDRFDMGIMVELRCEHWYCRNDLQGMAT